MFVNNLLKTDEDLASQKSHNYADVCMVRIHTKNKRL